jgi:hypothetical protein
MIYFLLPFMAIIGAVLNRIRGGWGKVEYLGGHTHLARLVWALPTGILLFMVTTPNTEMWYRAGLLIASVFVSYAFIGHGGHMVMVFDEWKKAWAQGKRPDATELLTKFWLPKLFGGQPDETWSEDRFLMYHITGMGFIGLVRSLIMVLPVIIIEPRSSLLFALSGIMHGFNYYFGSFLPYITWRNMSTYSSQGGELVNGAFMWVSIGVFYCVLHGNP